MHSEFLGEGPWGSEEGRAGLGASTPELCPPSSWAVKPRSLRSPPALRQLGRPKEPTHPECIILVKKRKEKGSFNFPEHRQLKPDPLVKGVLSLRKAGREKRREKEKEGRKVCERPFGTRGQEEALSTAKCEYSGCHPPQCLA